MEFLRTPEERFENLENFPYEPNYRSVPDGEGGQLRIHCVDIQLWKKFKEHCKN